MVEVTRRRQCRLFVTQPCGCCQVCKQTCLRRLWLRNFKRSPRPTQKGRLNRRPCVGRGDKIFAFGEDSRALRLPCKPAGYRAVKPNLHCCKATIKPKMPRTSIKRRHPKWVPFLYGTSVHNRPNITAQCRGCRNIFPKCRKCLCLQGIL